MNTLYLVSHTHWDREWYLTFQQFRLKLVNLVDKLLDLLEQDPEYRCFMLDGQTVVLEDYMQMRPEKERVLRQHVQSGRILIGPWHILPDEFLVSPEATVRNLLQGERTASKFGPKMMVGYIPDPFGHIGQMPQILRGFEMDVACFRRGLANEPCELWWKSPDGSPVLALYLRDGYDNAAYVSTGDPDTFVAEVGRLRDSLASHSAVPHLLLMHGTDHMEPRADTSRAVQYAQGRLGGDRLVHAGLPEYVAAVQACLATPPTPELPVVQGELRSPEKHHLLPAVLSSRMWIKQRNHASQALLEQWAEPFTAMANLVREKAQLPGEGAWIRNSAPLIRQAWRLLMENHPHDSICGCSTDQVHQEMRVRFDQVDQIGSEIVRQSLEVLAAAVDTRPPRVVGAPFGAAVVFNPVSGPRTDAVCLDLVLPAGVEDLQVVDHCGRVVPHSVLAVEQREFANLPLDRAGLLAMVSVVQTGLVGGMTLVDLAHRRQGETVLIDAVLVEGGRPDRDRVRIMGAGIASLLDDQNVSSFHVRACTPARSTVRLVAADVPGHGYRTLWLRPASVSPAPRVGFPREPSWLENEFLRADIDTVDGTLRVTDKRTGAVFGGLNRFVDGGDAGDEYTYSPPPRDKLVSHERAIVEAIDICHTADCQTAEINLRLRVPAELSEDRHSRSTSDAWLVVVSRIKVHPGVARVDVEVEVENSASDHRLRVHFPFPFSVTHADHDGHWEVVRRPAGDPTFQHENWVEQPCAQVPQRAFTSVCGDGVGLMVANRGLPEVAVLPREDGQGGDIALTLLRCVGWLSRDDLSTRRGHAGPMIATPGAQMPGTHTFKYAVIPHAGDWREAFLQAYADNAPMRAVSTRLHEGMLEPSGSFLQVQPAGLVLSAIKEAEDGVGWIARCYNITDEPVVGRLTPWRRFGSVSLVNLAERELSALSVQADGAVVVPVAPHQVITVRWRDSQECP